MSVALGLVEGFGQFGGQAAAQFRIYFLFRVVDALERDCLLGKGFLLDGHFLARCQAQRQNLFAEGETLGMEAGTFKQDDAEIGSLARQLDVVSRPASTPAHAAGVAVVAGWRDRGARPLFGWLRWFGRPSGADFEVASAQCLGGRLLHLLTHVAHGRRYHADHRISVGVADDERDKTVLVGETIGRQRGQVEIGQGGAHGFSGLHR
ncbi:hypothetical protein SDC9_123124 [bioreactor metagenome]|uniref:Uncharacterized protein n=1 Tax=bioreactor metagenome TaxID=1076179 RepID=A0A645CGT1_9ZZZZ